MATAFPYTASRGPLVSTINQLRRSFPSQVSASTLRKLGLAPKNESYVINTLRFLGLIDDKGNKVDATTRAFLGKDEDFAAGLAKLVKKAYAELFDLHRDAAWSLDKVTLTGFFRTADDSTEIVGNRQAGTFMTLAGLAGHAPPALVKASSPRRSSRNVRARDGKNAQNGRAEQKAETQGLSETKNGPGGFTMAVRIEINLPVSDDQSVYDKIFRSIRANLIHGE